MLQIKILIGIPGQANGFNYGQYLGKKLYSHASPQQNSNSEIGFIKDEYYQKVTII